MTCPACNSEIIRRSQRKGFLELMNSLAGRYPFRCQACQKRFNLSLREKAPTPNSERRKERVRDESKRKRRLILLFLASLLLFALFAWKFILPQAAMPQAIIWF